MPNTSLPRRAAPLVLQFSRKPVPPPALRYGVNDADETAVIFDVVGLTRPAGQLWERVAEAAKVVTS